jgi:hypothetical protein
MPNQHDSDRDLLIEIATVCRSMHDRLFGDGETGEIPRIHKQISNLQGYKNRMVGAVGMVTFLVLALGGVVLAHILGSK